MNGEPQALAQLDVLPPHCSIEADCRITEEGSLIRVRFRAENKGKRSDWSGWYDYHGEPIYLVWEVFWMK